MNKVCLFCHGTVTTEHDVATITDMVGIGKGRLDVHFMCFRLRLSQLKFLSTIHNTSTVPPAVESIEQKYKCGYCDEEIDSNLHEYVNYRSCSHGPCHLKCLSMLDYTRKSCCFVCSTDDLEETCVKAWVTRTTLPRSMLIMIPLQQDNGAKKKTLEYSELYTIHEMLDKNLAVTDLVLLFTRTKYRWPEPVYETVLQQFNYERLNIFSKFHNDSQCLLDVLITKYKFTTTDLFAIGLNIAIITSTEKDTEFFLKAHATDKKSTKQIIGPHFFMRLLLAGVRSSTIMSAQHTLEYLMLIDFEIGTAMAAGVSHGDIKKYLGSAARNSSSTMPLQSIANEFGANNNMSAFD